MASSVSLIENTFAPGARIGRYRIDCVVGAGGMGVVYAATDLELARAVAIKVVRRSPADDERGDAAVMREAQAMAKVAHPSVVPIHEVGRHEGAIFIVMELVRGVSLREWLARERRSWRALLPTLIAAGRGLVVAHEAGIVHRDFKPDNVLVHTDGRPCITDFGIAHVTGAADEPSGTPRADVPMTPAGITASVIAGTPAYMAPEQHVGRRSDARSDQFSYCVTMWQALFGERPFDAEGDTPFSIAAAAIGGRIRTPASRRGVPAWLERALRRGLSVDPTARWPSMAALLEELEQRPRRRRLALAAALAASLIGVAIAGWWLTRPPPIAPLADPQLAHMFGELAWDRPVEVPLSSLRADMTTLRDGRIVGIRDGGIEIIGRDGATSPVPSLPATIPSAVSAIGDHELLVFGRDVDDIRKTRLWHVDLATAKTTLDLEDDGALVASAVQGGRMRASDDGRWVVFVTLNELTLFDRQTRQRSQLLGVPSGEVLICPAWTPDSSALLFIRRDRSATRLERITLADRRHDVIVDGLDLVNDSLMCSSPSFRGSDRVVIFDYVDGRPRAWLVSLRDRRSALVYALPDAMTAGGFTVERDHVMYGYVDDDGVAGIGMFEADRASTMVAARIIQPPGRALAVVGALPDGRVVFRHEHDGRSHVATAGDDGVRDWTPAGAQPLAVVGDRILARDGERIIALRDGASPVELGTMSAIGTPLCSKRGACITLHRGPRTSISELDPATGAVGRRIAEIDQALYREDAVAFSPDATRLVIGNMSPDLTVLDLRDGSTRRIRTGLATALSPTWIDDGAIAATGIGLGDVSFAVVRIDLAGETIRPLVSSNTDGFSSSTTVGSSIAVVARPLRVKLRIVRRR